MLCYTIIVRNIHHKTEKRINMEYSKLGHTCYFNNTDIFVESDTRKITDTLVVNFINRYQNATNDFWNINDVAIKWFKSHLQYATYDRKTTDNGFEYHHIETKNGTVNTPVDDKSVLIILN